MEKFNKYTLNKNITDILYRSNDEIPGGAAPKIMFRDRYTDELYIC